ncbi:electron transfer flavoprotein subunit alpha/FixB family protein [uncultured Ilyobacter sp.]|jgi:electron transfer flavoprotein alpha subunit|uniref:electron transfer flavoprotein subunit alpha/FixB family protein n=1 Tax=uncultured Ilyobacter sp. TaxID=544433 RepID=UPI0029BFFDE5|nr:electron transfer flavoprotein subunit alpha/FixB family protein [uncultured Ilyobacter sp.]
MGQLYINHDKIDHKLMRELIELCPFNAIEEANGKLDINAGCKMCRLCVKQGKGAIELLEDTEIEKIDKELWKGLTVYVDHFANEIHPVTLELIGKAKELAKVTKHPVQAIIMGYNVKPLAEELLHYGVDEVHLYEDEELEHFKIENYTGIFESYIDEIKPSSVLVGATTLGRSLAPRVAARFRTGLTADCTILEMKENSDLVQIRPAFGGNIMAQIVTENHRPQFCTVRNKIFDAPVRSETQSGEIISHDVDKSKLISKINVRNIFKKEKESCISDAEVIVAVGRALKKESDMEMMQEFADLLGGRLACTRPLIESGWMDCKTQIGLSGRTVKPKIIFACGIHGAVQFTAGMENSDTIVAINTDENAPIFNVAHWGVVGDMYQIIPELMEKIKTGRDIISAGKE